MKIAKKYFGPCQSALEYFSRGNFKKLIEDYDGALSDYNNAIIIRPTFWEVYYQRGNLLVNMNKQQMAIADYNKAIELLIKYY